MEIKHKNIDDLNGIITITVHSKDYQENVLKILNDYKKKANIPGFRKGYVPLGIIKKQYEKVVTIDEVNKSIELAKKSSIVLKKALK